MAVRLLCVGDPHVDWCQLAPGADRKKMVLIDEGTVRVVGSTSEEITLTDVNGVPALQRTQRAESPSLGSRSTATLVLRSTFEPVSHHDRFGTTTISICCNGLDITGSCTDRDLAAQPIRLRLSAPVFDYHSVEMILRILPLREGYLVGLPVFHAPLARQCTVAICVQGKEVVDAGGQQMCEAWMVEVD
jgi:hypothetical protein